jgi:hypothetical protein
VGFATLFVEGLPQYVGCEENEKELEVKLEKTNWNNLLNTAQQLG